VPRRQDDGAAYAAASPGVCDGFTNASGHVDDARRETGLLGRPGAGS
jgi:hypothetical protein